MRSFTLKNRIIILLTVFTIVNIVLFIAVQLPYQLKTANNLSKSRAINVVSSLEDTWDFANTWEKIISVSLPLEKKLAVLQRKIKSLKSTQEISEAYILDKEAKIVFSTQAPLASSHGDFHDINIIERLTKGESIGREIFVDQPKQLLFIYVPLQIEGRSDFIIRLFFSLKDLWSASGQVYQPAIIIGVLFIFVNIILGVFFSRLIIGPIKVFNNAARVIASGRLDLRVSIFTNDELQDLANTFNFMAQELVKMKERAENANPLTKLPGNIIIMEEVEKRIKAAKKFTVIYSDLDNFKSFNDKYGIHQGDEAIKMAAEIFKEAVKNKGGTGDFVGHEGGDDFIILTTPSRAENVANYITTEFDKRVRSLYGKEDLDKGYIVAVARDGAIKQFPIMTISLAGVTNETRPIDSYAQVTNIAAEVKKKAKKEQRSCFILDKRSPVT
ncbi:MAG: GGDEF domain-containing protein [Candidatus Omnitrophota bacterium]|nr:GGDEF domain-containing protein [Candidatus Omnitrophota bacterium]